MSLLAVQGGATGTGTVTLLAPVTNTNRTLTLPDVTDTVAGIAATQTLTNKTLTSPTLTTPALGTPASGVLTNTTGLPLSTGVTGVLLEANGGIGTTVGYNGFKNRIINGAMVIDQRNAGASVTPASGAYTYTIDRFRGYATAASKYTVQQNAGSVTPPVGFTNYLGATSSSAYSVGSGDTFFLSQVIEGYNSADLMYGTANAQTVTLSFWVRSSLTGTFGGSLRNVDTPNRSYPFSYTISAANTWEQKSITIAGDTTGTWNTTNGQGIQVQWNLGSGTTFSGTAGAWAAGNLIAPTGATSVVGTNGATFYITGVQLEKGSTATSFDYRPIGTENQLCQRYFATSFQNGGTPASPNNLAVSQTGLYVINGASSVSFPVQMRASPTVTCFAPLTSPAINNVRVGSTGAISAGTVSFVGEKSYTQFGPTDSVAYQFGYTASAEL